MMKSNFWLGLSAPAGVAGGDGSLARIFIAMAGSSVVIAVPLLAFGYLLLGWINAEDASSRRAAQEQAKTEAHRIESSALEALDRKAGATLERIAAARREANAGDVLRQLIYSHEVSYVLVRRAGELVFPAADDWTFPDIENERRQLLSVAADLYARMDPPQGWYAGLSGIVFFRCAAMARDNVCFSLDEAALRGELVAALNAAARQAPGWSFTLRDSYNRVFWSAGQAFDEGAGAFAMGGALRGWTLQAAAVAPASASPARILAMTLPLALLWLSFVFNLGRRQAERAAQAEKKKAFLDRIAHDLRTPLANLKLFCEFLADDTRGNARAQDHCAVLVAEVDRLDRVAANAIVFGRAAAPQMRKAMPDDIVQDCLEKFGPRLAAQNRACRLSQSETAPLLFDVAGFERILVNLLDNACKYGSGAVSVGTRFEASLLRLDVRDEGPGIGAANTPSGSGLGLSIVRELARANHGSVSLINGQPGLHVVVTLQATSAEVS